MRRAMSVDKVIWDQNPHLGKMIKKAVMDANAKRNRGIPADIQRAMDGDDEEDDDQADENVATEPVESESIPEEAKTKRQRKR